MQLFPYPKTIEFYNGYSSFDVPEQCRVTVNKSLDDQEYIIRINETGILIEASSKQGEYYARITLRQLLAQQNDRMQHCYIRDRPDFEHRCVMMDLGRNHVPSLETLCRIVDILAAVKINQLQLYFEGFPFAYASHPKVWKGRDVLTPEDIEKLDAYCRERYIDLVPTLNAFGHMKQWLARDEYKDLAIRPVDPNGCLMPWGYEKDMSTIDPENPLAWELTKSLFDDMLPWFHSDIINICCDETFELTEKDKEGKDSGKLYFDYLMKIYSHIKQNYPGKTMMFWGDIVSHHPEYIPLLPNDLTPILWHYRKNQPTLEQCELFGKTGKPFYVAGSTSTHCTLVGDTETMISNADCCTVNGKAAGASGYIMTKWQDLGGWDESCVSYPAFVYGAMQSWNADYQHDIVPYLNSYVYEDITNQMAQLAMNLGTFRNWETDCEHYNGNGVIRLLHYLQLDEEDHDLDFLKLPPYADDFFTRLEQFADDAMELLESTKLQCADASLIYSEYQLLIRMILHAAKLGRYKQSGVADRQTLWELYDDIQTIIADYRSGWLRRNKNINLENSTYKLYALQRQYQRHLGLGHIKV